MCFYNTFTSHFIFLLFIFLLISPLLDSTSPIPLPYLPIINPVIVNPNPYLHFPIPISLSFSIFSYFLPLSFFIYKQCVFFFELIFLSIFESDLLFSVDGIIAEKLQSIYAVLFFILRQRISARK